MAEEIETAKDSSTARRWNDLDALRGFAMLLGIGLHASLSFFPSFWPAQDKASSFNGPFDEFLIAVHGFRMPLFFLLSGFFTAMLWQRRGMKALVVHRIRRVGLPLALGLLTIVPAFDWVAERSIESGSKDRVEVATETEDVWSAILTGELDVVSLVVTDGTDLNVQGEDGATPLHLAAFLGLPEVTQVLLESGADYEIKNIDGLTPLDVAVWVGSAATAEVLIEGGAQDIRINGQQWQDIDWFADGSEIAEATFNTPDTSNETGVKSWIDQFHHLWFLWFLCWLVAGFTVIAPLATQLGRRVTSNTARTRMLWVAFPLTFLFQLKMGGGGEFRTFGPDTSTGLLPTAHVLFYYAVFFGYGAGVFSTYDDAREPLIDRLGKHWKVTLPVSVLVTFPLAAGFTYEGGGWPAAALLQTLYTWGMTFGLIGLFRHFFSSERYWVRYLSDASYWMYLAHLPLVLLFQDWTRNWGIPRIPKFFLICWVVSGLLLLTYRYFVRYTAIGTLLNGVRTR